MGWLEESWHTWTPPQPDYTPLYVFAIVVVAFAVVLLIWGYLKQKK